MRQNVKDNLREFGAVPVVLVVLGFLFAILLAFDAGRWAFLAVGAVFVVVLIVGAYLVIARPRHADVPAHPALPEGAAQPLDDGVHRVLVIADDTCTPDALGTAVAGHGGPAGTRVFVVAPALGSRTARLTGDEHAYRDAQRHLDDTLTRLAELGVPAEGHVGSHDPFQAVEDGLREFPADEIVFVVHPDNEANWLERGVVEDARSRYPLPVREIDVHASER